ncbi:MAG: hypothetical protein AAB921_03680 [Patescibacteria group bacterium]
MSDHQNTQVTTAIVASYEEATRAGTWLTFPVLALPLGYEVHGALGWVFQSSDELTQEAVTTLLAESGHLNGRPSVQLFSVATKGDSPWKHVLAQAGPRVDVEYH